MLRQTSYLLGLHKIILLLAIVEIYIILYFPSSMRKFPNSEFASKIPAVQVSRNTYPESAMPSGPTSLGYCYGRLCSCCHYVATPSPQIRVPLSRPSFEYTEEELDPGCIMVSQRNTARVLCKAICKFLTPSPSALQTSTYRGLIV